jgi:hypothetical protein
MELTPFRGHFIFWEGGVHDVETKNCISAGVPATDGRVGPEGYAYLVPFVESENEIFLKTIIPSRKASKQYVGESDEQT